jgi:predicted nucleic acid-binding Zn ribbon protein
MTQYLSPLVSCLVCREVKSAKGIFSHFISSHTEDGRNQRSICGKKGRSDEIIERQRAESISTQNKKRALYSTNPNMCECGTPKTYEKRNHKFCSSTCAATHTNNKRRQDKDYIKKISDSVSLYRRSNPQPQNKCKVSFCVVCGSVIRNANLRTCSKECRSHVWSETAKNNPKLGGNKNNRAYGWYESPIAGRVWLESSYEYRVALDLDKHNVKWSRPKYLPYVSMGKNRKYFADFFLEEYNVYLDPKNDYLIPGDTIKINTVMEQTGERIIILNKNQLSWESIKIVLGIGFEPTTWS